LSFTSNDAAGSGRRTLLGCLLLLTFLAYANSLANGFVYDDHAEIEGNPYVHSVKYVGTLLSTSVLAFQGKGKQGIRNYYRPVTGLEFLLCYKLFGLFPPGFHLFSILMHCLIVGLVYAVTLELMSDQSFALIAAALFALHPIHTEAVDWLGAVSDLEVSIFYLAAFWLFLRLGREQGRRAILTQAAMLGSFLVATLSKEIAMTLPVAATLYEYFCRADREETDWQKKLSRYGGFWVIGALYLIARRLVLGGQVPAGLHADVGGFQTVATGLASIGRYAARLAWPAPLAAFYPFHKSVSFFDSWVLLGLAVLIAAAVFAAYQWRRSRIYVFALTWIFLTLAPVLNVHWMAAIVFAERYLYLPSVGFCWLVAGAILRCWRAGGDGRQLRRWAVGAVAGIVAVLFAGEVLARNRDWKDDGTIDRRTLDVYPEASYLRADVGMGVWRAGNHVEGMREWQIALAYQPDQPEALADVGFAMLEEKNYAAAIASLQKAIAVNPQFATPHVYLARVYTALGENPQAEAELKRAAEIAPTDSLVRNSLGQFYLDAGRAREAQIEFSASVAGGGNEQGWSGLAQSYALLNDPSKAAPAWEQVLALDPFDSHAHLELARLYRAAGRSADAQKEFESCLLMDPRNSEALAAVGRPRY
jgi:Tfp pilus assembly protein PilF